MGRTATEREGYTGRGFARTSRAYDASLHGTSAKAAVADAMRAVAHMNREDVPTGRPPKHWRGAPRAGGAVAEGWSARWAQSTPHGAKGGYYCLLYTSDAADE